MSLNRGLGFIHIFLPFQFEHLCTAQHHRTVACSRQPGSDAELFNLDLFLDMVIQNFHENTYYSTYINWFLHHTVFSEYCVHR